MLMLLAALAVLLLAPAAAAEQAPLSFPAVGSDTPTALALGSGGRGALVRRTARIGR